MSPEELLDLMERSQHIADMFIGLRSQLVRGGWSEHMAEHLVLILASQMGGR